MYTKVNKEIISVRKQTGLAGNKNSSVGGSFDNETKSPSEVNQYTTSFTSGKCAKSWFCCFSNK